MKNNKGQNNYLVTSDILLSNVSTSGSSKDITIGLTTVLATSGWKGRVLSQSSSTGELEIGVCLDSPYNFVHILNSSSQAEMFDQGLRVYGKISKLVDVYTINFFTYNGVNETSYSFSSTVNLDFYIKYRFEIGSLPPDRDVLLTVKKRDNATIAYNSIFSPEASGMNSTNVNDAILEIYELAANNPSALTFVAPLYEPAVGFIGIRIASSSVTGVLTSTDWTSFNSRVTTALNLGNIGAGVFQSKNGTTLQFRKILPGPGVTVVEGLNTITISANRTVTGGDATYFHTQSVAVDTWVVEHGLGKYPAVTVLNVDGVEIFPQITHNSNLQTTIVFKQGGVAVAVAGYASFN